MTTAIAAIASVFAGLVPAAKETAEPHWKKAGCEHGHKRSAGLRGIKAALMHHRPLRLLEGRRAWHFARCTQTPRASRRLTVRIRELGAWRRSYAHRWPIRLNGLPAGWVQWARNITACESGWNRYASNGTHFSYFQFSAPTWAAASTGFDAPASPYDASWPHQAVIAIHWAWEAGTSQWVCKG